MIYETLSTKVAHSTVRKFLLTHEIFFGTEWKRTLKINVNLNCETLWARVVNSGVRVFSLGGGMHDYSRKESRVYDFENNTMLMSTDVIIVPVQISSRSVAGNCLTSSQIALQRISP